MEFGVFDHLDSSGLPLPELYEGRLRLTEAYDRLGFYAYHLAEHHSTPLGMAPSPSVFLSAVAQRTRRLRFGPLVYLLPLYHPLRLIEEICMLDQMSGGRLEIGVGRGISPIESTLYGQNPEQSQAVYTETLELLLKGLTSKTLDFTGKFHRFDQVPMALEPLQKPHPPLWLGVHSPDSAEAAARRGINILSLDPAAGTRKLSDRYRSGWRASGGAAAAMPKVGMSRFVVISEDGAAALAAARRAYPLWHSSFNHLYRLHGRGPVLGARPADFDAAVTAGVAVAGRPAEVAATLQAQVEEADVNYLVAQFAFGDISPAEALTSIELYARHIMPALAGRAELRARLEGRPGTIPAVAPAQAVRAERDRQ